MFDNDNNFIRCLNCARVLFHLDFVCFGLCICLRLDSFGLHNLARFHSCLGLLNYLFLISDLSSHFDLLLTFRLLHLLIIVKYFQIETCLVESLLYFLLLIFSQKLILVLLKLLKLIKDPESCSLWVRIDDTLQDFAVLFDIFEVPFSLLNLL